MRKAQAAVEFLLTYGWAIIVVLAALGALSFFGVFDLSNFLPDRCHFPTGIECIGRASISSTSNEVRFIIQNNYGSTIVLNSGTIGSEGDCSGAVDFCSGTGCSSYSTTPLSISNNNRATVRLNCTNGINDGRFRTDVTLAYNDTLTNFQFKATGQIRGKAIS